MMGISSRPAWVFPRILAGHLANGPMILDTPSVLEEAHQVVRMKQK